MRSEARKPDETAAEAVQQEGSVAFGGPDTGDSTDGEQSVGAAEAHDGRPASMNNSPQPGRAGRNLPMAITVALVLGGLVLLTLFTVKATFLLYMGLVAGVGLWELSRALHRGGMRIPVLLIMAGGATAVGVGYWLGAGPALVALALTFLSVIAWRLRGGPDGYLRDVTAAGFAVLYIPLLATFAALMLARPDGDRRVLLFIVLTVCADVGGYFAGILAGRHLMAPAISPKKTWEGLAGSAVLCLAAGATLLPVLLHGHLWQGLVLGVAAVAVATLGDLAESMIKRDLRIKDMGSVLPGHGGVLDRIDALLVMAPAVWLLLAIFVPS